MSATSLAGLWFYIFKSIFTFITYIKSAQTVDTYNNITICDMCHDHVSMTMSCVLNVDMFVRRQNLSSTLKLSWALQNSLWLLLRTALPFLGGSVGAKKNQCNISLQGLYKWTLILNTIEVLMVWCVIVIKHPSICHQSFKALSKVNQLILWVQWRGRPGFYAVPPNFYHEMKNG